MWKWNLHIEKESFIKRKPRVKRPNLKYKGYDSIWEYLLHETILKDWKHHVDKVDYVIKHSYEPDFVRVLKKKKILLESKGRFWDHAEYSKYIWIKKTLSKDTELVFLFAKPEAPMPGAKKRKDGTKRTHAEWAEKNGFRWFSEETLPDYWVNIDARESGELKERLKEVTSL